MDFIGIETFKTGYTPEQQARKVQEEADELFAEIHNVIHMDYSRVLDEGMDTIVAVANLFNLLGFKDQRISEGVKGVNRRNADRDRLGYVVVSNDDYISNVSFGAKGILAQVAEDKAYALRFDNRENAQLMADLLFNFGVEADVIPYAPHP